MSRRERQRRRRRNQHGAGRVAFLGLGVVTAALALTVLGIVAWVIGIAASAPSLRSLSPIPQGQTSIVYAADGQRLGYVQSTILRSPGPSRESPQSPEDAQERTQD